jgi:hypothetical protein
VRQANWRIFDRHFWGVFTRRLQMKSFRRKDGQDEPPAPGRNGERNFRGEKRSNETHASTTDPDARLAKKSGGQESKMGFTGHLLMENRNGLVVDARLTRISHRIRCIGA